MSSTTSFPVGQPPAEHRAILKARTILNGMELDGLIETQDGDTYRITDKGKALADQYRESV